MPAPYKKGLDYFPFDVDLLRDRKLRKPRMQFGYLASVVYLSLLSLLYKDKGYYVDYTQRDDVIWAVLEDLQGKYQPTYDTVVEVIEALAACGLFSGDLFQAGIITSRRAQETYYSCTVTRKTVDIEDELWLLDMETMKKLSAKHCYYQKRVNEANNAVNGANNEVNRLSYSQSKVKKSIVKESKEEERTTGIVDDEDIKKLVGYGEKCFGRPLTPLEVEKLAGYLTDVSMDWVLEALTVAGEQNARSIRYVDKVLDNWINGGYGRGKEGKAAKEAAEEARKQAEVEAWLAGGER